MQYTILVLIIINILINVYYYELKNKKEYLIVQQSGYDIKRYIRYIKEKQWNYLSLSEVIMILTLIIYNKFTILALLIILILTYFNIRFFLISESRFNKKLKLVITKRIKRLILTETIILVFLAIILLVLGVNLLYTVIIIDYLSFVLLIVALFINAPIENNIKEGFKKKATAKLEANKDITVIGITGSYGKTSIKNIINDVLSKYEPTLTTASSFNTPNGISITLNNELSVLHKNFIAEMGAYYVGEIKELAVMTKPDIGIVSSIGNQHLETFKTIENIQRTKMELIENLNPNGHAILNMDEKYIKSYKIKRNDITIHTYAIENKEVDIYARNIQYEVGKMTFEIFDKQLGKSIKLETKLLGKHNIYNILAAYIVAKIKGIETNEIVELIKKVNQIPHRLEMKKINTDTVIIDDAFNGNVRGIKEGINIISEYKKSGYKAIIITPGLIDLGEEQEISNKEVGKEIATKADMAYIIGNYNRKYFKDVLKDEKKVEYLDNFLEGYNKAMSINGKKVILIANDLPDKFN